MMNPTTQQHILIPRTEQLIRATLRFADAVMLSHNLSIEIRRVIQNIWHSALAVCDYLRDLDVPGAKDSFPEISIRNRLLPFRTFHAQVAYEIQRYPQMNEDWIGVDFRPHIRAFLRRSIELIHLYEDFYGIQD